MPAQRHYVIPLFILLYLPIFLLFHMMPFEELFRFIRHFYCRYLRRHSLHYHYFSFIEYAYA